MGLIAKALLLSQIAVVIIVVPELSRAQGSDGTRSKSQADQSYETHVDGIQNSTGTPSTTTSSTSQTSPQQPAAPGSTLDNSIAAGESEEDLDHVPREMAHWNEYRGPYFTVRASAGLLLETAAYAQDNESKQQLALRPDQKLRDFRFILKGSLPSFERKVTWSTGIMYDAPTHSWLFRETGLMIGIPELRGNVFIGRTKEGFSLNKVMVGYAGWTMERSTMNDASIPILADGIKWLGYTPKHGFLWNVGYYNDWLSKNQAFSTYHHQTVGRFVWLPIHSEEGTLFHLGVNLRYGVPEAGKIQFRSRPEAFPAPYFVDTGKFNAESTRIAGYETYYRKGPLLFGSNTGGWTSLRRQPETPRFMAAISSQRGVSPERRAPTTPSEDSSKL